MQVFVQRGEPFVYTLPLTSESSMAGWTFDMAITTSAGALVLLLNTGNGRMTFNSATKVLTLALSAADTNLFFPSGTYVYDIRVRRPLEPSFLLVAGSVVAQEWISRTPA